MLQAFPRTKDSIVTYLSDLFVALDRKELVDLYSLGLHYDAHLKELVEIIEQNSAAEILGKLMTCVMSGNPHLNTVEWFGGQWSEFVRFTACGTVKQKKLDQSGDPLLVIVSVEDDCHLQDLFDTRFSSAKEPTPDVRIDDMVGEAVHFEKIDVFPLVLGVQVNRLQKFGDYPNGGLDKFYSTLKYGMELDVSEAMSDVSEMPTVKYKLVSLLLRQTTFSEDGTHHVNGHYMAVVSVPKPNQDDDRVDWWLCDDEEVSALTERNVLSFNGVGKLFTFGEKNKKRKNQEKYFVEYFQFVREDHVDEYRRGFKVE
jgi:hypothetical protein